MSTESRTERAALNAGRIAELKNRETIDHIRQVQAIEAIRVADLKLAGHSCIDCGNCRAVKFSLGCFKPGWSAKPVKWVKSYNICPQWASPIGVNTDEDS